MGSFTWLGGDLGSAASWSQPDPMNPVEPGIGDSVIIPGTGTVSGSVTPHDATISGTFTLAGSIASVTQNNVTGGTMTIQTGATLSGGGFAQSGGTIIEKGGTVSIDGSSGSFNVGGTYDLQGGSVSASASVEAITAASTAGFKQSGGTNTAKGLEVVSGSYTLSAGTLSVGSTEEYVGNGGSTGTASFTQTGGTQTLSDELLVGYASTGEYTLSGGGMKAVGEYIGQNATGTFTQTGGTNTVSDRIVLGIDLNNGSVGTGTYTLGGKGGLQVATIFIGSDPKCHGTFDFNTNANDAAKLVFTKPSPGYPNLIVGGEGIGKFNQGGGAISATSISVGFRTSGVGTYSLTAGTVSAQTEHVGDAGTGVFTQHAGSNSASLSLVLGCSANAIGTYNLDGGSLTSSASAIVYVGLSGQGQFNQDGGTATVSDDLRLGANKGSDGTYNLSSGKLIANSAETVGVDGHGTFSQDGGSATIKKNLTVGDVAGSTGTYKLTGGTLKDSAEIVLGNSKGASGTMDISGANSTVSASTFYAGAAGKGELDVGTGAKLSVANTLSINSQSTILCTAGTIGVGAVTPQSGAINIGTGGKLIGAGTVKADIHELADGSVESSGGTLTLTGKIDGGGVLQIDVNSTLDLSGADSNNVYFAGGTLKLEKTGSVTGTLTNMKVGDIIDLVGITATSATRSSETLTVTESNGTKLTFQVLGSFSGTTFAVESDGHGGTDVVLDKSSKKAPEVQADHFVYSETSASSIAVHAPDLAYHHPAAVHIDEPFLSFVDAQGRAGILADGHFLALLHDHAHVSDLLV